MAGEYRDSCSKCGRKTSNKYGLCKECRTKPCITCGKLIIFQNPHEEKCVRCGKKKPNSNVRIYQYEEAL